jgi:hypothetical protein
MHLLMLADRTPTMLLFWLFAGSIPSFSKMEQKSRLHCRAGNAKTSPFLQGENAHGENHWLQSHHRSCSLSAAISFIEENSSEYSMTKSSDAKILFSFILSLFLFSQ